MVRNRAIMLNPFVVFRTLFAQHEKDFEHGLKRALLNSPAFRWFAQTTNQKAKQLSEDAAKIMRDSAAAAGGGAAGGGTSRGGTSSCSGGAAAPPSSRTPANGAGTTGTSGSTKHRHASGELGDALFKGFTFVTKQAEKAGIRYAKQTVSQALQKGFKK